VLPSPILKKKDIFKYRDVDFVSSTSLDTDIIRSTGATPASQSYREAASHTRLMQEEIATLPLQLAGRIPTSKGALMLLEDEGWDLDLLANINNVSLHLRKRRPYSLRKLRRLRRLRRLRLMSINLYLHRSKNVEIIQKDQIYQGRNHSKLNSNDIVRNSVTLGVTATAVSAMPALPALRRPLSAAVGHLTASSALTDQPVSNEAKNAVLAQVQCRAERGI